MRSPAGTFRMHSEHGGVVESFPAAALGGAAPTVVQRAALREFAKLSDTEIASVANELEGLRAVVERIWCSDTAEPGLIGSWLRSRNRGLSYRRPLEALREGRADDVMFVADCFVALSPPVPPLPHDRADTPLHQSEANHDGSH